MANSGSVGRGKTFALQEQVKGLSPEEANEVLLEYFISSCTGMFVRLSQIEGCQPADMQELRELLEDIVVRSYAMGVQEICY